MTDLRWQRPVITITSDFGTADHYVGTMKCVIAGICPNANVIDLTHDVQPFDTLAAAYVIGQAAPFTPPHSTHIVVVDPGVGGRRRAIAVRQEERTYIAPDNGVLTFVMGRSASVRELKNPKFSPRPVSDTFHGRDLFAPAAAHFAAESISWGEVGPEVKDAVRLEGTDPVQEYQGRWRGMVLSVDRFGNIITNLPVSLAFLADKPFVLQANALAVRTFARTFSEAEGTDPFVYAGSSGFFEVGINQGSAAQVMAVTPGTPVVLDLNS